MYNSLLSSFLIIALLISLLHFRLKPGNAEFQKYIFLRPERKIIN